MSTPTPIRRSEQLAPLSRDHHEGLLLSWKIRQGMKYDVDKKTIADYVRWFWTNHLEEHFREEEELLGPYMRDHELMNRMFAEHEEIRKMVASRSLADAGELTRFADLLNDHIRFEERELFGVAEKLIPREALDRIEEELNKETKIPEPWKNEFWLQRK